MAFLLYDPPPDRPSPVPAEGEGVARVAAVNPGARGWGVLTLMLPPGRFRYQPRPCPRCPWRRDAPRAVFSVPVFQHSARTTYDLAEVTFGCHASDRRDPLICAGFLLRGASDNLRVRLAMMHQEITVSSPISLYDDYREMAVANGVEPDDPALRPCRGDRRLFD